MESGVANLFAGLTKRRIDRRELIRTLGFLGGAAFAAPLLPKATFATGVENDKIFPMTTVNHLSLNGVNDYAKSRDWYVDLFGMRVVWDNGRMCALEMGPLKSPNGIYVVQGKPGDKATIGHIAFGISDWWSKKNAMKAEMDRLGLKEIRPDGESGWTCNTPSGYMIQAVPEKDEAMYPGAARPCESAQSDTCKAGWQEGLKNLADLPQPTARSFNCVAFSPILLNTSDIARDRDFFQGTWGMKVVSDDEDGKNPECLLKFGYNTLCLRQGAPAGNKPFCRAYCFLAENYNEAKAEAELRRRGLNPEMDLELGWVVSDPDGLRVGVRGA